MPARRHFIDLVWTVLFTTPNVLSASRYDRRMRVLPLPVCALAGGAVSHVPVAGS